MALVSILRLDHCVFKASNMYLNKVMPAKKSVVMPAKKNVTADAVLVF